ncbi:MAG: hypothetical protein BWY74_00562 [Firmicutes bacterium ADurb.Bin419]|nr:MAG: hypothetical protein BWY74_00562 [Firmicutes bacterium ADurb.Bin419]
MKKLINKALLYRDWKYSKWFIPVLFLELLWVYIPIFLQRNEYGRIILYDMMYPDTGRGIVIYVFFTLTVMASVMFTFDRSTISCSFAASMPFTKKEIIASKWFVGFYNIFVACISVYVIENVILILDHNWAENFVLITLSSVSNMLYLLFILGFILMLQSINGTVFVGGLISLVFAAVPGTLIYLIRNVYSRYNEIFLMPSFIKNTSDFVWKFIVLLMDFLGLDTISDISTSDFLYSSGMIDLQKYMSYWTPIKIIIYLAAVVLMFIVSVKLFCKSKFELNGRITTVVGCNRLYKAIMAFYAGFLIHAVYLLVAGRIAFRPDIVIVSCVIIPVPFYFIMGKIIKIYNKRFS